MKQEVPANDSKKNGRPRAFEESVALNQAMLAFWRYGYESTSMSVLAEAMGMNSPSIYAAFGDKKALFLKALDLYVGNLDDLRLRLDAAPSASAGIREMVMASIALFTGTHTPHGCMLASATASGSAASEDVQAVAAEKRAAIEHILKKRIARDIHLELLPQSTSATALAALTIVMIQGLSVLARDGSSRKKLVSIAEMGMQAWVHL